MTRVLVLRENCRLQRNRCQKINISLFKNLNAFIRFISNKIMNVICLTRFPRTLVKKSLKFIVVGSRTLGTLKHFKLKEIREKSKFEFEFERFV